MYRIIAVCFFVSVSSVTYTGLFGKIWNEVKDAAEDAYNEVKEAGEDAVKEIEEVGKKAINEIEKEYNKVENELEKAKNELEDIANKFEDKINEAKNEVEKGFKEVADVGEDVVNQVIDQVEKLGENPLEVFERFNVRRIYFHGSTSDIADGVMPRLVIVTGVKDDEQCTDFQFNANKPKKSVEEIAQSLFKMILTGGTKEACQDVPEHACR